MWEDPIVAEIHRIREQIAARHNYDLHAICQAMREQEKTGGREVVTLPPRPVQHFEKREKEPVAT